MSKNAGGPSADEARARLRTANAAFLSACEHVSAVPALTPLAAAAAAAGAGALASSGGGGGGSDTLEALLQDVCSARDLLRDATTTPGGGPATTTKHIGVLTPRQAFQIKGGLPRGSVDGDWTVWEWTGHFNAAHLFYRALKLRVLKADAAVAVASAVGAAVGAAGAGAGAPSAAAVAAPSSGVAAAADAHLKPFVSAVCAAIDEQHTRTCALNAWERLPPSERMHVGLTGYSVALGGGFYTCALSGVCALFDVSAVNDTGDGNERVVDALVRLGLLGARDALQRLVRLRCHTRTPQHQAAVCRAFRAIYARLPNPRVDLNVPFPDWNFTAGRASRAVLAAPLYNDDGVYVGDGVGAGGGAAARGINDADEPQTPLHALLTRLAHGYKTCSQGGGDARAPRCLVTELVAHGALVYEVGSVLASLRATWSADFAATTTLTAPIEQPEPGHVTRVRVHVLRPGTLPGAANIVEWTLPPMDAQTRAAVEEGEIVFGTRARAVLNDAFLQAPAAAGQPGGGGGGGGGGGLVPDLIALVHAYAYRQPLYAARSGGDPTKPLSIAERAQLLAQQQGASLNTSQSK